jgi:hypothetical protein
MLGKCSPIELYPKPCSYCFVLEKRIDSTAFWGDLLDALGYLILIFINVSHIHILIHENTYSHMNISYFHVSHSLCQNIILWGIMFEPQ